MGVSGDAVNTAARIQTSAGPGEILVGQETSRVTRTRIQYGDAREVKLRGRASSIQVFSALRLNQTTVGVCRPYTRSCLPSLFRRSRARDEGLVDLWNRARTGEGQLVSIVGEPGVGKSRLIAEFVSRVADDGHTRLVQGRCLSYGQEVSLWLIADLWVTRLIDEDDSLDTIRDRLDVHMPSLLAVDDEAARLEARDVVGEVLGLAPSDPLSPGPAPRSGATPCAQPPTDTSGSLTARCDRSGAPGSPLDRCSQQRGSWPGPRDVPGLRLLVLVAQREGWTPPWSDLGCPSA